MTVGRIEQAPRLESPPGLDFVLRGLEMVALRLESDGSLSLLTEATAWFNSLLGTCRAATGARVSLHGTSDFLDHFLCDADEFWGRKEPGRLRSGPWLEETSEGIEHSLEAQALWHQGAGFLLLERLGEAHDAQVRVLQSARDHLLKEEELEREVRRRTRSIRLREEEIAMRLLAAAATRDGETGSHVRRIGLYAAAIGEALGWEASASRICVSPHRCMTLEKSVSPMPSYASPAP